MYVSLQIALIKLNN